MSELDSKKKAGPYLGRGTNYLDQVSLWLFSVLQAI